MKSLSPELEADYLLGMGVRSKLHRAVEIARFMRSQRSGKLHVPDSPHMDEASTAEFLSLLAKARLYAEFGSGGSTIEAAKLGVETISVDSDRFFAEAVVRKLAAGHKVTLHQPNIGLTAGWGEPVMRKPTAPRLAKWQRYLDVVFDDIRLRQKFPDLFLIDGRFRAACILEAGRQAREASAPTTIFVDDYEDRPHYHLVERWLGSPQRFGRAAVFPAGPESKFIPKIAVATALEDYR